MWQDNCPEEQLPAPSWGHSSLGGSRGLSSGWENQQHPSCPLCSFHLVTPVNPPLHHHLAYPLEAGGAALDEPQQSRSWEWIEDL